MGKLFPGKGGHFHLNSETLEFVYDTLVEINDYLCVADSELTLDGALDAGKASEAFENLKNLDGWSFMKDKFGTKVYKEIPWRTGAYRITVVLTAKDELKLDIREWYLPDA